MSDIKENGNITAKDTKDEVKKVKKVFKGDILTAKELASKSLKIPVERIDKANDKGPYYHTKDFSRFMIVDTIQKSTYPANSYQVTFAPPKTSFLPRVAIVPDTFKFKVLTGTFGKSLADKYAAKALDNLATLVKSPLPRDIGTDPEIFIEDKKGDVIPAFDFLGSKLKPNTFPAGNIYWDGFQAEFTPAKSHCMGWLSDNLFHGLQALLKLAKAHDPNAKLSSKTFIELTAKQLTDTPQEYIALGCMPSFNVYGLKGDLKLDSRLIPYRSAGGHLHFGIGKQKPEDTVKIVKALDSILGVACVSLFASYDHPLRRRYYGQAGEYRLPPHGIEYRVLSNAWLFHPAIANLVFDLARVACNFGINDFQKLWNATEDETINTIMACDVDKAREIIKRNEQVLDKLLIACYGKEAAYVAYYTILNGMEHIIKDPTNIDGNWLLSRNTWILHCDSPAKNWSRAAIAFIKNKTKV